MLKFHSSRSCVGSALLATGGIFLPPSVLGFGTMSVVNNNAQVQSLFRCPISIPTTRASSLIVYFVFIHSCVRNAFLATGGEGFVKCVSSRVLGFSVICTLSSSLRLF